MYKNWRGLPVHAVDEWDAWQLSREEYEEMKLVYDMLVLQGTDMDLILKMMKFAVRQESLSESDRNAGEDI